MTKLDDILNCIGVDAFNKLIRSFDDVKRRNRFRFWHAAILERASTVSDQPLTNIDTFLAVFANVQLAQRAILKEDFLSDPMKFWSDGDTFIDPEWIAIAWKDCPLLVDAVSYDIARSVSKTGEFNLAISSVDSIRHRLLPDQYLSLYVYVRDESDRLECEWRPEFCRLFPESVSVLPPELVSSSSTEFQNSPMKTITAQEWELLSFFEVEPELLDSGEPWVFNGALYRVIHDDVVLTFAVQPSYRDVRLALAVNGQTTYELSAMGVDDVLYRKEDGVETIEIRLEERHSVLLSLKPHLKISQKWGGE